MAKTSTHTPFTSFISAQKKKLKEVPTENPSEETIRNILNFSKALEVKKTSTAGMVDVVLN